MALPKPDPQKYRGGSTNLQYKADLQAWQDSQTTVTSKPDPQKYRGGSTSSLYKRDLAAWEASQQDTKLRPQIEPVGQEVPVSLASSFDEEPDPFAPEPVVEFGPGSGYRGEPDVEPVTTATGYREPGDVTPPTYTSTPETQADFLNTLEIMRGHYGNRPIEDLWFAFEREYRYDPEKLAQVKEDYMALSQESQTEDFTQRLTDIGVSAEDIPEFTYGEGFDAFGDSLVSNERDFYGIYDDQALETYGNIYSDLQGLDARSFVDGYTNLDRDDKKIYLYEAFKAGDITEAEYQENMAGILLSEGKQITKDPNDGQYKYYKEVGDGHYYLYKINLTPEDYYNTFRTGPNGQDTLWTNQGAKLLVRDANRLGVDVDKRKEVAFLEQGIGSFGEDTTVRQTTSEFFTSGILDNPLTQIVAAMTGMTAPLNALKAGVKVINGDTLHGEDWAALATPTLEKLGIINKATNTGIGGLDYNQTVNAIDAMVEEDPVEVVMDTWGNDIVNDALADVGLDLDDLPQGVKEGVNETVNSMLSGDSFEEAAQEGLLTYLEESPIGEVVEDKIKEVGSTIDDKVIQPLLDVVPELDVEVPDLEVVEDIVRDIGSVVDDEVIQPIKDELEPIITAIEEAAPVVEDVVRDVGSTVEDVVKPVVEPVVEVVEEVAPVVEDVVRDVGSTTEDIVRDVGSTIDDTFIEPAKEFVESIETPDLPEVDLPSIDLPSIDLDLDLQLPRMTMPSPTRTTDSLFGEELFRFKTEIGVSPEAPLIQAPTRRSAQVQQQQQQPREQYVDLFDDPFANTLRRKV